MTAPITSTTSTTSTTDSSTDRAWQGIGWMEGHRGLMDSRSGFETNAQHELPWKSVAVTRAGAGSEAWKAAGAAHREAGRVGHEEFYGLTAEWAQTLAQIGALMRLVGREVAGYADTVPAGCRVYDDERAEDPRELLDRAAAALDLLSAKVTHAAIEVNVFWSLIGRIGVEDIPTGQSGPDKPEAGTAGTGVTS